MASQSSTNMASASNSRFQADWDNIEPEMDGTRGAFMGQEPATICYSIT
jgi:hypothetical protein